MRTEGFTNAEFGNSNVWFPNSSTGCAAAGGCRHCRPKNPAASIYGGWVRVLSGGSKWLSALPAGSKWPSAPPTGSNRLSALPTEDFGRFNLWRPIVVA